MRVRSLLRVAGVWLSLWAVVACSDGSGSSDATAKTDCPAASHPWQLGPRSPQESGDGLPPSGTATRTAATAVLAADRATLVDKFGAADLSVRVEAGRAWTTPGNIVDEDLATIVLTIPSNAGCPTQPWSWNGIPLTFQVGASERSG